MAAAFPFVMIRITNLFPIKTERASLFGCTFRLKILAGKGVNRPTPILEDQATTNVGSFVQARKNPPQPRSSRQLGIIRRIEQPVSAGGGTDLTPKADYSQRTLGSEERVAVGAMKMNEARYRR